MNARFYFANLCADVMRCVKAAEAGDEKRYADSLARSRKTLRYLRTADRPEAYEEGLLLVYGMNSAYRRSDISAFAKEVDRLMKGMFSFGA